MVKLIVSDLDDTLIHKDEHLPNEVIAMVKKLREQGVEFTFATGRMPYRAYNFAQDIDLKIPFVANNGSILYCNGKIIYAKKLRAWKLRKIVQRYMAEDEEFTVLFSYESRERPLRITHWIKDRLNKYPGYNEPLGCDDCVWEQEVHKIYVVDEYRTGLIGRLAKELKEMQDEISCYQYGEFSMEIVASDCSKATGVQKLVDYLGCLPEEVMALGDHTNDIEVLQMAGIGVAVSNAVPELKAVADYITKKERADGVVEAIQHFVLKGELTDHACTSKEA